MALDFNRTFGGQPAQGYTRDELPKAQTWMNVGYITTVEMAGVKEDVFVSLPVGIPLDTQEPVELRGRNEGYRALQAARNDLLEQCQAEAAKLAPGEDKIIGDPKKGLVIQLRRIQGEMATPEAATNPFGKKLFG